MVFLLILSSCSPFVSLRRLHVFHSLLYLTFSSSAIYVNSLCIYETCYLIFSRNLYFHSFRLQMACVRDACSRFLLEQLDPSNCLGIANFAVAHGCTQLAHAATTFVQQHFKFDMHLFKYFTYFFCFIREI